MTQVVPVRANGDAIQDTNEIQKVIDKAYDDKKPVIIQLEPEDYYIGYLIDNNTQTAHFGHEWTPFSNVEHRGLILKTIPLSQFDNNLDDAFIEIRGTQKNGKRTRLVRMSMPESPILGSPIYDDINRLYKQILDSNLENLDPSLSNRFTRRIQEINDKPNNELSDFERFAKLAQGATHIGSSRIFSNLTAKNLFLIQLLRDEVNISQWFKGLRFFSMRRTIGTADTRIRGAANQPYTSNEDSALIEIKNLNYNGGSIRMAELGWRTDNTQLEHSAGIIIYGNSMTAGKVRFNASSLSIHESPGDGIHIYENSKSSLSHIQTSNNGRGGIAITGRHSNVELANCTGVFNSKTLDGINVELDYNGYSDEFTLDMEQCYARRIKLTVTENSVVTANKILTYGYFSQASFGANVRISNSSFVSLFEDPNDLNSEGNQVLLAYPGDTIYTNCTFSLKREKPRSDGEEIITRFQPLVNINTKRKGHTYKDQHLQFVNCQFKSFTSQRSRIRHAAVKRTADLLERNNQVTFQECSFSGAFRSTLDIQGGTNHVNSPKFMHPVLTNTAYIGIFYFHSEDAADKYYHARLKISGDLRESDFGSHPFIRFNKTSSMGEIDCEGVRLTQGQNNLVFAEKNIKPGFSIVGRRRIETTSLPLALDSSVDGLIDDSLTLTIGNRILQVWKCIQHGDNIRDSLKSKWREIS